MIILSGQPVTNEQLASFQLEGQKRSILMQLQASNDTFRYRQASDLLFEVTLRSNIMNAARDLNKAVPHLPSFKDRVQMMRFGEYRKQEH